MQSVIILALLTIISIFGITQYKRSDMTDNNQAIFKAENVAGNIFIYHDLLNQYVIINYDKLGLSIRSMPGRVGQISLIDYVRDRISKYSQMNFNRFLNYQSVVFNYTRELESQTPVAYMATSWNGYIYPRDKNTNMLEVLGQLSQDMSKRLYQGNSTYWTIPWIFSQTNCEVREMFSQIPDDRNGNSRLSKLKISFKNFCTNIEAQSSYRFLGYVYMQPIYKK
jgi:hypothetical protein